MVFKFRILEITIITFIGFSITLEYIFKINGAECSSVNNHSNWVVFAKRTVNKKKEGILLGDSRTRGNIDSEKLSIITNINFNQLAYENIPYIGILDYLNSSCNNKIFVVGISNSTFDGVLMDSNSKNLISKLIKTNYINLTNSLIDIYLTNTFCTLNPKYNIKSAIFNRSLWATKKNEFRFKKNRDLDASYLGPDIENFNLFYKNKSDHINKQRMMVAFNKIDHVKAILLKLKDKTILNGNKIIFIFHPLSGPYFEADNIALYSSGELKDCIKDCGFNIIDFDKGKYDTSDFSHVDLFQKNEFTLEVGRLILK